MSSRGSLCKQARSPPAVDAFLYHRPLASASVFSWTLSTTPDCASVKSNPRNPVKDLLDFLVVQSNFSHSLIPVRNLYLIYLIQNGSHSQVRRCRRCLRLGRPRHLRGLSPPFAGDFLRPQQPGLPGCPASPDPGLACASPRDFQRHQVHFHDRGGPVFAHRPGIPSVAGPSHVVFDRDQVDFHD